jgi:TRAP-type C4-dicarboxylate transport system permease small subunit
MKYLNHAVFFALIMLFVGTALSIQTLSNASFILTGDPMRIPVTSGIIIAAVTFVGILTAEWWAPIAEYSMIKVVEESQENDEEEE